MPLLLIQTCPPFPQFPDVEQTKVQLAVETRTPVSKATCKHHYCLAGPQAKDLSTSTSIQCRDRYSLEDKSILCHLFLSIRIKFILCCEEYSNVVLLPVALVLSRILLCSFIFPTMLPLTLLHGSIASDSRRHTFTAPAVDAVSMACSLGW